MYLPEKMLQLIELSEDQIMAAYKNNSNIVVSVESWDRKKRKLKVAVGEFVGIIPESHLTIYPIKDESVLHGKVNRLIGTNIACKILRVDKKRLILSRASSMKEAFEYFKQNPDIDNACVVNIVNDTAFVDIGFGIKGKLGYHHFTYCKYNTLEDAGCQENKVYPMKITGMTSTGETFKLSHRQAVYLRDFKAVSELKKGDTIRCRIGEQLEDRSGYFIDFLPNISGIVDTIKYDYLLDNSGKKCRDDAIPPLEYGRYANIFVKEICKDKKGRIKIRGRFVEYCE